jgi:hypothetical protein
LNEALVSSGREVRRALHAHRRAPSAGCPRARRRAPRSLPDQAT